MLKVVHVASGDLWAGAELSLYELCCELHRRNVDVYAVLMNEGELSARLEESGIRTFVFDENRQSSLELLRKLRRLLSDLDPDVVHTHRMKENVLGALSTMRLKGRLPVLVKTVHGASEYSAPLWSRSGAAMLAERVVDRFFDVRVAVSADLLTLLRQEGRSKHFVMIHNGIRPAPPHVDFVPPHEPIVGFAGRLVPVKRVDLLLRTLAELSARQTEPLRFEIAGDGPLRATLMDMARRQNVAHLVDFLGFRENLWQDLARWSALLITSDHEGLPMACLEALAAGVPVVARNVGGLREVIRHPAQGMLVDSDAPSDLADAILAVLSNGARAEMRQSLLDSPFTSAVMADNYIALYEQLLLK